LIYRPGDLGRAAFLNGGGELTRDEVRTARRGLIKRRAGTISEMARASKLGRGDFLRLVDLLEQQGVLEHRRGRLRLLVDDFDANAVPLEGEQARRAYERSRLEMMRGYAETRDCRRQFLLAYFGEDYAPGVCRQCDNDRARSGVVAPTHDGPFAVHERVRHPSWGEGVVQRLSGDTLTVLFDLAGYKTLALDLVLENQLLVPA
jgi:ATP-dependent DNA helicase RecQ